ncbi:hypothetical protein Fcan01_03807 [Folsomia candida]|uniref:Uncharacterized protein n=1 Tax=Folsomia candida TaxID=158441 RepID=A0A226EWP8_FOLCA|nr:hypothetical protein Fcan01_03807 [Folsomia candida]
MQISEAISQSEEVTYIEKKGAERRKVKKVGEAERRLKRRIRRGKDFLLLNRLHPEIHTPHAQRGNRPEREVAIGQDGGQRNTQMTESARPPNGKSAQSGKPTAVDDGEVKYPSANSSSLKTEKSRSCKTCLRLLTSTPTPTSTIDGEIAQNSCPPSPLVGAVGMQGFCAASPFMTSAGIQSTLPTTSMRTKVVALFAKRRKHQKKDLTDYLLVHLSREEQAERCVERWEIISVQTSDAVGPSLLC